MTVLPYCNCRFGTFSLVAFLVVPLCGCQRQAGSPAAEAARTFGHRQLEQVLADRPDMAGVLRDDDPVVAWVIAGFNGERIGQRVYWNGASPESGQAAEHWPEYYDYPAQIRVSGGTELTPIDRWTGLVFEFFNLENSKSFDELLGKANSREIDGDAYARGCTKLEFEAHLKAKAFFQEHPLPPSSHGNDPYYKWIRTSPEEFDDFLASTSSGRGYNPLKYFRDRYDEGIAPFIPGSVEPGHTTTTDGAKELPTEASTASAND